MKRRHHSLAENKRVIIIHTSIRPSNSLQVAPLDKNKKRPLVSFEKFTSTY